MKKFTITFTISGGVLLLVAGVVLAVTTSELVPSSDGFYRQWTPKSGTSHVAMVDEAVCNGQTDFNDTNTIGERDSYGVTIASSTIPDGATITRIDIIPCASAKRMSASSTLDVFYRFNGVNGPDAGHYHVTTSVPQTLATTTFSNLNLYKTSTSTLEIGIKLVAGNDGGRLSRIGTVITYATSTP